MTKCTRRQFLAGAAAAAAAAGTPRSRAQGETRPNIVFLLTDDQRYDMLGCAGAPFIRTPAIDAMAAEGVRFTHAFVTTPICCASRASVFTGEYSIRHQLERFDAPLSEEQYARSYPVLLREAGYHSGFIGKWGLGGALPAERFDYWRGFEGQGVFFPEPDRPERHLTTIMSDQAEEFLRGAPKDRPFHLSISYKSPHVQDNDPRQFLYDPRHESLYQDVTIPYAETATAAHYDALPGFLKDTEARKRWERRFANDALYQQMVKGYYRLITGVDESVARIRAVLEDIGAAENTIIVFHSDNGFFLGERGWAGKWTGHEESLRVPLIVFDPRAGGAVRGQVRENLALNIDIAPTLLAYAGVPAPAAMQGTDLAPICANGDGPWRDAFYFEHHFGRDRVPSIPANEGVRTKRWKYIRWVDAQPLYEELYDLAADPKETANLAGAAAHAGDLAAMRELWARLRAEASAPA